MGKLQGRCLICGSADTIKAHIFPRAILLDIRAEGKTLIQGDRGREGVRFSQNGDWDDTMLCKEHEDRIGAGDDYAVRFLRTSVESAPRVENGKAFAIPNPSPAKLMHFAYACVWRAVNSLGGKSHNLTLGRYNQVLCDALMNEGPYDLQVLIGYSRLGLNEVGRVSLAINPHTVRMRGLKCWQFVIGLYEFYLFTDRQRLPREWSPYLANGNDPLIVSEGDIRDIREVPRLRPLLEVMKQSKKQNRSS
jgi:hypothetical protein